MSCRDHEEEHPRWSATQSALTDLLDTVRSGGDLDFMREAMQLVLQARIDLKATERIGVARYEQTEARTANRNGGGPGC